MAEAEVLEKTALVPVNLNPVAVYTDATAFDTYYEQIRLKYADGFVADISTDKGRKEVASQAFKVVKEKTSLVAAGKKLTEEARQMIKAVNDARNGMEDRLDGLAKEIRLPLTQWEEREAARVKRCEEFIVELRAAAVVQVGETADAVHARLDNVQLALIDEAQFQEFEPLASALKATAVQSLVAAVERLRKEEADRAELDRLRAAQVKREQEEAERLEREEEQRLAAEAKAREAEEAMARAAEAEARAKQEEADRQAAIEAERERIAGAAEMARLQTLREAEQEAARELAQQEAKAAEDRRRMQAAHDAELAEAQRQRDEAIAEQRRQDEERRRLDQVAADAAEQRRREDEARTKDRTHRSQIMSAAKEALMASCDLTEPVAKQIVLSICAGDIPNVALSF